jgi:hypothetical protein
MNVQFKKAFKFNLDNFVVEEMNIPVPTQEEITGEVYTFNKYFDELILDVLTDPRSKKFLFPVENTAIKTVIQGILHEEQREAAALDAARQLLRIEQTVDSRIEHMDREVQKGIMIQALVEHNGQLHFIIVKAEHLDFMNERDNRKTTGLPIKKKIFKSFCAFLDGENHALYAHVNDTKVKIATYWWQNFLSLEKELTDEQNTENAFEAFETKVFNKIKTQHPEDWMSLRNATISYFRSNTSFILDDFLKSTIIPYEPVDSNLNMTLLENRIRELPANQNFEPRFDIVREKIKKRMVNKLRLNSQLTLVIDAEVSKGTVNSILVDGVKYIRIKSDSGYDMFPKLEN